MPSLPILRVAKHPEDETTKCHLTCVERWQRDRSDYVSSTLRTRAIRSSATRRGSVPRLRTER